MFTGIWPGKRQETWCADTLKRLKTPPACIILGIELDHPAFLPRPEDVAKAFRAKSLVCHPDRQDLNDPAAQARANDQMAELNKSREILQSLELMHEHIIATVGCDDDVLDRLDPRVRREFDVAIAQQRKTKIEAYYDVIYDQYIQLSAAAYSKAFQYTPPGTTTRTPRTKVTFDTESDTELDESYSSNDDDDDTSSSISSISSIESTIHQPSSQSRSRPSSTHPHAPRPIPIPIPIPVSISTGTDLPHILNGLCTDILNLAQRYLGPPVTGGPSIMHIQPVDKIAKLNSTTIATTTRMTISGNQNTIDTPFNVVYGRNNTIRSAFNYCAGENTFPYGVFLVIIGSTAAATTAKTHFSVFIDPVVAKSKTPPNAGACNQYYDSIDTAIKMGAVIKYNGVFCINPHKVIFGVAKTKHDFMFRVSTCRQLLSYLHTEIRKCDSHSSSEKTKKRKIHE